MGREYPEKPMVGVGAVLVSQGRVLLVKRGQAPLLGEWSIPGGSVEVGETLPAAVCREMREETGLDVRPVEVIEVLDRIIRDENGRVRYHWVLVDYLCCLDGAPRRAAVAASDVTDCRWAAPEELAEFHLRPEALRIVEKAFGEAARNEFFRDAGTSAQAGGL